MPDQYGRMTVSEMQVDLAKRLNEMRSDYQPPVNNTPKNLNNVPSAEDVIAWLEDDEAFNQGQPKSWSQSTSAAVNNEPQPPKNLRQPGGSFGSHSQWKKPIGYESYPSWAKEAVEPGSIPRAFASYARQGLNYAAPAGLIADAFNNEDRTDRKVGNIVGNVIGGAIGSRFGNSGAGALAGGWVSDRILNLFDSTDGKNTPQSNNSQVLLENHLSNIEPYQQVVILQEQLRQARLQQKEMERMMAQQYLATYSSSQPHSGFNPESFSPSFGELGNPYQRMGGM